MVKQFIKKNNGKYIRLDLDEIMLKQIPKIIIELEICAVANNTSINTMNESQLHFLVSLKMKNYLNKYDLDKESAVKALEKIEKTL